MQFIRNLSIGSKLQLAPLTILTLLLVITVTAYQGLKSQQNALTEIYQIRFDHFNKTVQIQYDATGTYAGIYRFLSWNNANFSAARKEALAKQITDVDLAKASSAITDLSSKPNIGTEEKALLEAANKELAAYRKALVEVIDITSVDASMATTYMSKAD